ncbi:hypothetical protein SAMN06298216_1525 [Spirosomataceae bacterium TFI 002]|nr:hypothetical protein SAMN06298216_1525 [Spirosomataceae bacterium TFI 002]
MDKQDLIDNYFEGNLSKEDELELNQMLELDAEFAEEFVFQKEVRKAIHLRERVALKDELKTYHKPVKVFSFKTWFAAAAVLILGAFLWVYLSSNNLSEELYTAYYQPFPNVVSPVVRGNTSTSSAFEAYENEDYIKAEVLFRNQYQKDQSDYSYFYWGVCLLENNKIDDAVAHFEKANYSSEVPWKENNDWYHALALIKNEKLKEAKAILEKLRTLEGGLLQEKATELLQRL